MRDLKILLLTDIVYYKIMHAITVRLMSILARVRRKRIFFFFLLNKQTRSFRKRLNFLYRDIPLKTEKITTL